MPRRGDLWPCVPADISLPEGDLPTLPLMEISPSCAAYLKDLEGMVLSPEEMCQVKVPSRYTDPALQNPEGMLQLASRLYDAQVIRGVDNVKAYVGLFTVVKKVTGQDISLRLILDARQSNSCWTRPLGRGWEDRRPWPGSIWGQLGSLAVPR